MSEVSSTLKLEQLARLLALKLPATWASTTSTQLARWPNAGAVLVARPLPPQLAIAGAPYARGEHGAWDGAGSREHGSMEAMVEALGVGRCAPRKCRTNESPNGIPEIARMPPPMAPSLDRAFLVLSRSSKPIFSLRFHTRGQSCGRIFTNQPLSPAFHGLRLDK